MSERESNTQAVSSDSIPWLAELKKVPEEHRFLPLLAAFLPKISKLRLFKAHHMDRTKLLEAPMPTLDDLDPLIDALLQLREERRKTRGGNDRIPSPHSHNAYLSLKNAIGPDVGGFALNQDTTLDVVVDHATNSWSIGFGRYTELRGENLAELQARSRHIPAPTTALKFDPPRFMYMSAAEAAKLLGVAKSTVTRRIRRNEVIGFRVFKSNLYIPREQFMDLDVVPGVREVLNLFSIPSHGMDPVIDHKNAWVFLAGSFFYGDRDPRPIDRLRTAARNHGTQRVVVELTRVKRGLDRGDYT